MEWVNKLWMNDLADLWVCMYCQGEGGGACWQQNESIEPPFSYDVISNVYIINETSLLHGNNNRHDLSHSINKSFRNYLELRISQG